jgi:hypothetical protein
MRPAGIKHKEKTKRSAGKCVNVRHTTYVATFLLLLVVLLPYCKCLCWLLTAQLDRTVYYNYRSITPPLPFGIEAVYSKSSKSGFGAGYLAAVAAALAADSWGGAQKTTLAT